MSEPSWDTPARLNGLPCTNWKKRTGVTASGTVGQMFERWLDLPDYQRRDCTLGWGPNAEGQFGSMSGAAMARYVTRNGLPPGLAARVTNAAAFLAIALREAPPDFREQRGPFHDAAPVGKGPRDG